MPRPKPLFSQYKHLLESLSIQNEEQLKDNFNVNSKIIIKCSIGHLYISSITKIKSLGNDPRVCPHCKIDKKNEEIGVPFSVFGLWANKYNFSVVNAKKFYKRWMNDVITVKCNKHDFIKEIKSIGYLEQNLSNTVLECPECSGDYVKVDKDILPSKIQEMVIVEHPLEFILEQTVDMTLLPAILRRKLELQNKWNLISYINTKNKCKYQCVSCGKTKDCTPHSIFSIKGGGCSGCQVNTTSSRTTKRLSEVCRDSNFYPKNKFIYESAHTPISLICNSCGAENVKTWVDITGACYKIICKSCFTSTKRKGQQEFTDFITSLGVTVECDNKTLINPYELDVVCHSEKIAFEFCGVIWHSTKFKSDNSVHYKKFDMCNKLGYRLITIFDDEWNNKRDICKSRIQSILGKSGKRVYARKTEIVKVDQKISRQFFIDNHIQGSPSKMGVCYSLVDNNGITVCMMSFGKRHGKIVGDTCQWELQRYAAIKGYSVVGGAGKLLNAFMIEYKGVNVVTFSDNRWGSTDFYTKIGFTTDKNIPYDYTYCGASTLWNRKHKFGYDKKKLRKKCKDLFIDFLESDTEIILSEKVGLYRVYDCGHKRYILKT